MELNHGFIEAAFSCLIQAENYSLAAKLAEENVLKYYELGRFQTLRDWARSLYPVRLEVPTLFGCAGMTYATAGEYPKAEEYLSIAGLGLERSQDAPRFNALQASRAWLAYCRGDYPAGLALAEDLLRRGKPGGVEAAVLRMAASHAGLCVDAMGKTRDAIAYFRQALALFPDGDRSYDQTRTLTLLANGLHAAGETAEGYILQRRALAQWKDLGYPGPIAIALNNLAFNQHLMGQLEEAEASYNEALEWSRKSGDKHSQLLIFSGLGDLAKDRAEFARAAGFYSAADRLAEESDDLMMLGYVYRARADLNRRLKNYPAAMEWVRRAEELVDKNTAAGAANDQVFRGAVLEEMGNREEAAGCLAQAVEALESEPAAGAEKARARFLLARSQFRSGGKSDSEKSLRAAFDFAYGCGSDQTLIREAPGASDLLEGFLDHATMGGLCGSLLERARRQTARESFEAAENLAIEPVRLAVKALGFLEILWSGKEI